MLPRTAYRISEIIQTACLSIAGICFALWIATMVGHGITDAMTRATHLFPS